MRNGLGIQIKENGDKYEGLFHNDKKNGNGKYIFCDGSIL